MRCLFLITSVIYSIGVSGQSTRDIADEITTINSNITRQPCSAGKASLISNRAMNVFLADKTAYLSEPGDLSYYTNYVTLNSSTGMLTINHNFQKAKGIDEPIRKLFSVGVRASAINGLTQPVVHESLTGHLGVTVTLTWLGKVQTNVKHCTPGQNNRSAVGEKETMDALRSGILNKLTFELEKEQEALNRAIKDISSSIQAKGQQSDSTQAIINADSFNELQEEYRAKFATLQAEALTRANAFRVVRTHWTTFSGYVPLAFPSYLVAPVITQPLHQKRPYPFEATLSHTRFSENSKTGKLFVTVAGRLTANNAVSSYQLDKVDYEQYKVQGGSDTIRLADRQPNDAYIGHYKTFFTPSLKARVVYFSHDSHVGLSVQAEQHFGTFNLLNARMGIPVVLINRKKLPALNIEFQVNYFDVTGRIKGGNRGGSNHTIGVAIGFPMSRLMY